MNSRNMQSYCWHSGKKSVSLRRVSVTCSDAVLELQVVMYVGCYLMFLLKSFVSVVFVKDKASYQVIEEVTFHICLFLNRWWRRSRLWQRKLKRKWIAWAREESQTDTYLTWSQNICWLERENLVKHREDKQSSELKLIKTKFMKTHF